MARHKDTSLMRSLGQFLGHIVRGAKADVPRKGVRREVVRHDVEQEQRQTESGQVTLRRTTIEEVEFEDRSE